MEEWLPGLKDGENRERLVKTVQTSSYKMNKAIKSEYLIKHCDYS